MNTRTAAIPRSNNFDLIRLVAALQVVYGHALEHLKIENPILQGFYDYFLIYLPGVPIFFFISGFLIFWSFERNADQVRQYSVNRFLRIYPALWVCVLLSVGLLLLDAPPGGIPLKPFGIWLFGQLTLFQFYTPDALRFWGVGTPNGSLWTIPVELQYYAVVPLVYFLLRKSKNRWAWTLAALMLASMACNFFLNRADDNKTWVKLGGVTVVPYLYYFLAGTLVYKIWDRIAHFFIGKFWWWLLAFGVFVAVVGVMWGYKPYSYWIENPFNLLSTFLLLGLTFSTAFTNTSLGHKLLKGNDISYGVYIYHMLVVNYLVHHRYTGSGRYFLLACAVVVLLALLSWRLVEKKALALKRHFK